MVINSREDFMSTWEKVLSISAYKMLLEQFIIHSIIQIKYDDLKITISWYQFSS